MTFGGRTSSTYCSPECKFWSCFDRSGGPDACWPWKFSKNTGGYGDVPSSISGKRVGAHRHAFKLATGIEPGFLSVCHDCDRPSCGNPSHLWAGTQRDNMIDAIKKGRFLAVAPGELHPKSKLTDEKVRAIRSTGEKPAVLAERFGVTPRTIYAARRGATWRHVEEGPEEPWLPAPDASGEALEPVDHRQGSSLGAMVDQAAEPLLSMR